MRNMIRGFCLSLQFLTRLPIKCSFDVNEQSMKWALRFFPAAGYIIGFILIAIILLFQTILPAHILALLIISLWVYITGGLHLDGWMDVADAAGSNAKMERKHEIMKDSRVGSFAVLAVFFLLIWKMALVYEIFRNADQMNTIVLLLAIPVLSRFQALLHLGFVPSFQNKGMAHTWQQYLRKTDIAIAFCFLIPFVFYEPLMLLLILLQFIFSYFFGRWAIKQFKGINGDLVGASIEGAELWNVSLLYIYILSVMA